MQGSNINSDNSGQSTPRPRLNLLLSYGGWQRDSWVDMLPNLLRPLGIHSIKVDSGLAAETVIRTMPVHIAVIDLRIPLQSAPGRTAESELREEAEKPSSGTGDASTPIHARQTFRAGEACGERVLQLIRRLRPAPPTVVVRDAQPVQRDAARGLSAALREGAFSVIDHPVRLEMMLEILRRITRRYYADLWPAN